LLTGERESRGACVCPRPTLAPPPTHSHTHTHTMGALTHYGGGGPLAGLTVAQKRALAVS